MFNYVFYLSEKQFKYVSFAINNDINETTFSCLKNPVNPGPLGHKHCTLKCRALYTDLACTAQQLSWTWLHFLKQCFQLHSLQMYCTSTFIIIIIIMPDAL